eukprot:4295918-Alexandrium_andersonii.AAC.1
MRYGIARAQGDKALACAALQEGESVLCFALHTPDLRPTLRATHGPARQCELPVAPRASRT